MITSKPRPRLKFADKILGSLKHLHETTQFLWVSSRAQGSASLQFGIQTMTIQQRNQAQGKWHHCSSRLCGCGAALTRPCQNGPSGQGMGTRSEEKMEKILLPTAPWHTRRSTLRPVHGSFALVVRGPRQAPSSHFTQKWAGLRLQRRHPGSLSCHP